MDRGKKGQMLCHTRKSGLYPNATRDHRRVSGRIMVHQTYVALTAAVGRVVWRRGVKMSGGC